MSPGKLVVEPGLALEPFAMNDVERGRMMVDDLALLPLAQDPAGAFARNMGERRHVVLTNAVADDYLAGHRAGLAQVLGELQQRARHAGLERQEARRRHLLVGLPQALDQTGDQV